MASNLILLLFKVQFVCNISFYKSINLLCFLHQNCRTVYICHFTFRYKMSSSCHFLSPIPNLCFSIFISSAPPHPQHVRVARIAPELLTVQWADDTTFCRGSCLYLVRYQQTSPYNYNTFPVQELPVDCRNLPSAQPSRSTNPNAYLSCTAYLSGLIPGALYNIDVYASSYNVLSETAAQLRQRTRES